MDIQGLTRLIDDFCRLWAGVFIIISPMIALYFFMNTLSDPKRDKSRVLIGWSYLLLALFFVCLSATIVSFVPWLLWWLIYAYNKSLFAQRFIFALRVLLEALEKKQQ